VPGRIFPAKAKALTSRKIFPGGAENEKFFIGDLEREYTDRK
jgi:hypothetical protein